MDLVISTVSQGLLWALLAIGVYITFRVLDIADLTVEGSFPLGAAVAAKLLTSGAHPVTAILVACIAGAVAIAGAFTAAKEWKTYCARVQIPAPEQPAA